MSDAHLSSKPRIRALPGTFDIHRLPAGAETPVEVRAATFVWMGRTEDELSIVCRPDPGLAAKAEVSAGWTAIQVEGPLDFSIVGLLADITGVLAAEEISVFALSTFDTDYVLVPGGDLDRALGSLAGAGYEAMGRGTPN